MKKLHLLSGGVFAYSFVSSSMDLAIKQLAVWGQFS